MCAASLNTLAEARNLSAWESWSHRSGYFKLPMTSEAVEFYRDQGFLVVEDALTPDEVEALRKEATAICAGKRGMVHGLPTVDTDDETELLRRVLCVHFPHQISPLIMDALAHPSMVEVLTNIIGPNVKCMQSMLFIKSAGKPGQAWHQDEVYIPTRDRSLTGGWIALDDATVENGCLWVLPGSHRNGVMYFQEWHGDPRFDCALEARNFPWSNDEAVPVEVKAGSIVFFNGYLLHRSLPNYASAGYRRSLVNHYMSSESLLPWYWGEGVPGSVASLDNRNVIQIAGVDPYAYRGTESTFMAHVRPDGKGGCGNNEYNTGDVEE